MMWPMRRSLSGVAEYCLPSSWAPALTSHSRNSALMRPLLSRLTRPTTSACALMARQSGKRGTASKLVIFSMKAFGSTGAKRPLRRRLLVMMSVTVRAGSASPGEAARKSAMAMGIGATLPLVTGTCSSARAGDAPKPATAAAAAPVITTRRLLMEPLVNLCLSCRIKSIPQSQSSSRHLFAEHFARIEIQREVAPNRVFGRRQEAERRAFAHRAHRAFRRDLEHRQRAVILHRRLGRERSVLLEQNVHRDDEVARIAHPDRYIPAFSETRAQRVELVRRQRHRRARLGAERGVLIECQAGRSVALRCALVQQREPALDRRGVELLLLALLGLERLLRLFLLLRLLALLRLLLLLGFLLLLRLVALERLGDRVGLRRHRLLRRLLGRLRRLGIGRRRGVVVGRRLDFRLVGDLRGRVLDRARLADLVDDRLRHVGLLCRLRARHHMRQLVFRDRVDRDRADLRRQRLCERG